MPTEGRALAALDPRVLRITPAEAAARPLPLKRWRRLVLAGSHGQPLVGYVVELELGCW